MAPHDRHLRALCMLAVIALASRPGTAAVAAQIQFTLPTLTAPPGATVLVPIESSPAPSGLGIQAVEFRMDFTPGVIQAAASRPEGWIQSWGAPFANGSSLFIAVAAGGFPATASEGTLLNRLELTISPSATPGTDMPLTFQHVLCNEGEPAVVVVPGLLRVRTTAAVGPGAAAGLALSPASPNPASASTRFALTVPSGGTDVVRVAVYAVDGRLVRELASGPLGAGRHEFAWDTRDAAGRRVPAGLYFARASRGTEAIVRRLAVAR